MNVENVVQVMLRFFGQDPRVHLAIKAMTREIAVAMRAQQSTSVPKAPEASVLDSLDEVRASRERIERTRQKVTPVLGKPPEAGEVFHPLKFYVEDGFSISDLTRAAKAELISYKQHRPGTKLYLGDKSVAKYKAEKRRRDAQRRFDNGEDLTAEEMALTLTPEQFAECERQDQEDREEMGNR